MIIINPGVLRLLTDTQREKSVHVVLKFSNAHAAAAQGVN